MRRSGDQLLDHLAPELGKLLEAAGVEVGELRVVEAEEAEQGDVEIADVVDVLDGLGAGLVGGADGVAGVDAAASEPDGHGLRVVIAAKGGAHPHAVIG